MRRYFMLAVLSACLVTVAPGIAAAETTPTVTLTENCVNFQGDPVYGVTIALSGFPPNSEVSGSVAFDGDATNRTGSIFTDASGNATAGFTSPNPIEVVTVTVNLPGGGTLIKTLERPCQGPERPTTRAQCMKGGFVQFGFKSRGDCVSYVVRSGKNR